MQALAIRPPLAGGRLKLLEGAADEAEGALVAAGQKFLAVVERDEDDTRALSNWGRALCVRAELARDTEVCHALIAPSAALPSAWARPCVKGTCPSRYCSLGGVRECVHLLVRAEYSA